MNNYRDYLLFSHNNYISGPLAGIVRLCLPVFFTFFFTGGFQIPTAQAQCDVEVSGVMAYCNSFVGNNTLPGYFIGFRVQSNNGDTLNVIDLNGNVPMNKGKRINDINNQAEPSDTSTVQLMIGGGMDSLEFWYFGPFADGDTFNIVLVDPNGICDTIYIASGTFTCQGQDPNACDADVPLYYLDFSESEWEIGGGGSSNENVDDVFIIMQRSRVATCCQVGNARCFEFIITLDEDDLGLLIDDVGSGSTAGNIYADSLNGFMCGTSQSNTWPYFQDNGQSGDDPICLGDAREWIVLSCKTGNNVTGVSIGSVGRLNVLPQYVYADCTVDIDVLNAASATWTSIDDPNLDNLSNFTTNNLSATFSYDQDIFGPVTSCQGDTFTYFFAGFPDNECLTQNILLYDTSYVVVYPPFSLSIDTTCLGFDSLLIEAILNTPAPGCEYAFQWSTGDTTSSIVVPNTTGQYSISVTRPDLDSFVNECTPEIEVINVEPVSVVCVPDEFYACVDEPSAPDTGLISVGGCGINPIITISDVRNEGIGCGLDTLIITRYYIVDFDGDTINTATDKDTCIQRFLYVDNVGPVISCPENITLSCGSITEPPNTGGSATAIDNCDPVADISYTDLINPGSCPREFVIIRTWTATDDCGNTNTCNQTITLVDNVAPIITCPANVTIQCTDSTLPANTGQASAIDNCDPTPIITFTNSSIQGTCPRVFTRTWRATDDCGNSSTCTQTITLIDTVAPVTICPPDITISCSANTSPSSTGSASGTDNCDPTLTISHTDITMTGACPQNKSIIRTWSVRDDCNNISTCVQTITVVDLIAPVITCPADITLQCSSSTNPMQTGSATAVDNCDATIQITFTDLLVSGPCANSFSVERTWTATDDCGNFSTCLQVLTINDDVAPEISCPVNITIECNTNTLPVQTGYATAIDNCDGALDPAYLDEITPGDCPQEFLITRTWTIVDGCGNASSCVQTISVEDNTAPVISCPADITLEYPSNTLPSTTGQATAVDNCDDEPLISYSDSLSTGCVSQNLIYRTWTSIDDCGNLSSCLQLILIEGNGSICGTVQSPEGFPISNVTLQLFADVNANGFIDSGDTLVASVMPDTITGGYCFLDILPCTYVIKEVQPSFYVDLFDYDYTPDPDGNDSLDGPDNEIPVILSQAEVDSNNNFIDIPCIATLPQFEPDTICENGIVIFETQSALPGMIEYVWDFGSGATPATANGTGPHSVSYITTTDNQTNGAIVELTIIKEGCPELTGQVSSVDINPYPDATIEGSIANLCYYANRSFKPVADEIPNATYTWNFGSNAIPATATGYGPHIVYYTVAGTKTVELVIHPNEEGAQCPDSSSISFNVVTCTGNITGVVKSNTGVGIQGVNIRLYMDVDTNGIADNTTIIRSVFTTANGSYSMVGLTPGNYVIIQTQPAQWVTLSDEDTTEDGDIVANIDPMDNLIPSTLNPSEIDGNNNFIETASPGSILGMVFIDLDGDEMPDPGEGLPDVTINLFSDNDKDGQPDNAIPLGSATSSNEGSYVFSVVPTGNYVIQQVSVPGYTSIKDYDATNDLDTVVNSNQIDDIIPVTITNAEIDDHNYFIDNHECSLIVVNTNDGGPGSLRYMLDCATTGDSVIFDASLAGDTITITSERFEILTDLVIYSTANPPVTIVSAIPGLFDIGINQTLWISGVNIVSGITGYPAAAFYNFGILYLNDVNIRRNPLLPPGEPLILNNNLSQLIISGNCSIFN